MVAMTQLQPVNGPPIAIDTGQLQRMLEASPNTGNHVARFASVMEQVLTEQRQAYRSDERERIKERKVSRVADSEGETEVSEHTESRPPGYYKTGKTKHTKKKEEPLENLFEFNLIDFRV